MATPIAAMWMEQVERTLERYDEALLRQVSDKLFRPRSQWPAEELVARGLAAVGKRSRRRPAPASAAAGVPAGPALIGHSRQPRWRVGGLLEMLAVSGAGRGCGTVLSLLEQACSTPCCQRPSSGSRALRRGSAPPLAGVLKSSRRRKSPRGLWVKTWACPPARAGDGDGRRP